MLSSAAELPARSQVIGAPVRLLHAWHLLSLDAPTVAFCWTLLFARTGHVPHPLPQAFVLACAVWLIYVADRLLDARKSIIVSNQENAFGDLSWMYRNHSRIYLWMFLPVSVGMVPLLLALPQTLLEAWSLLAVPLFGYAVAVHLLCLAPRWKSICIGGFFGIAAALPAAIHVGISWSLALAALLFGCACVMNCNVLRGNGQLVRWAQSGCILIALLCCMAFAFRQVNAANVMALCLLQCVQQARTRLEPLTYRALADAALVVPVLVLLAC